MTNTTICATTAGNNPQLFMAQKLQPPSLTITRPWFITTGFIKKPLFSILILLILLVKISFAAFAYSIPQYQGLVNDFASTLTPSEAAQLDTKLTQLASLDDGLEIALVTVKNLEGEPIEDVALQFFDTWQIGKAKLDNGVLILLALEEQQVRIQTGYGSEGFLNDAKAGRIIRDQMAPRLQQSQYYEAYNLAIDTIINEYEKPSSITIETPPFDQLIDLGPAALFFLGALLTYVVSFLGRTKSWWAGGILGAIIGYFISRFTGVLTLGLIGLILDYILSKNYKKWHLEHKSTSWRSTLGGFHHPGKSGFKFGGGRTGGGGATGKW